MKSVLTILFAALVANSFAQETLQTVSDRGQTTTPGREINLPSLNPAKYLFLGGATEYARIGAYDSTWGFDNLILNGEGGNVGIGLSSPKSKLDVAGQINSFFSAVGQTDINTSTKNYANFSSNNHGSVLMSSNLFFSGNDDLKIANTHQTIAGASVLIPGNGQPNQGGIVFYTNIPGAVAEGQTFTGKISMVIHPNGNVGIGTANPTGGLEIFKGAANQPALVLNSSGSGWGSGLEFKNTSAKTYGIYAGMDTKMHFSDNDAGLDRMLIDSNGNIGIGTTTPKEKLSVNGKIRAKEIRVEANNWPDYVFEEGYDVGTLKELESYIKTNKHLPEMPSAKEVETNGIAVGEMLKLQQKKIEELTLHLIEKDKQLNEQKTINKSYEERLLKLERKSNKSR